MRQEPLPGPGASWVESRLGFENLGAVFFQGTLEQEEPEKQAGTRVFQDRNWEKTSSPGVGPQLCGELSCAVHCNVGRIVALSLLEASDPPTNTV